MHQQVPSKTLSKDLEMKEDLSVDADLHYAGITLVKFNLHYFLHMMFSNERRWGTWSVTYGLYQLKHYI